MKRLELVSKEAGSFLFVGISYALLGTYEHYYYLF